ncbi:MAG: SEC-C metal-binding domain-containing protein, partial [Planctomycetota bacterium]
YPKDKIKEAILHPNIEIRWRATSYFAKSFSSDLSIMPLVIKAVETYGRQNDAYRLIGLSRDLPQTEDTITWVIDELNDEQTDKFENYAYNLSMVLVEADPTLLLPRESDILEAPHFLAGLRDPVTERLQMLSWDEATCWQKLEEFCEEGKDKRYTNEVNLSYANLIVEALARYGQECEPKVLEWMAVKLDDYSHHRMKWLEALVVRLAGQVPLESTIPLIVAKLLEGGGDLLNHECAEALTRIGTPAVLHAVAEALPTAERHFRIYATDPLEHIQSDLAVEISLKLLELEKGEHIRCELARALLCQFAPEGIEITRNLLVGGELDFDETGLRNYLLETCTLTGERFPEYEEWMATEKAEKEEHWKKVKELEGDPSGLLLFALEKLAGKKAAHTPKAKPSLPRATRLRLPREPAAKRKVGRNDPCPCGSGKKFKTCCMRR